ncbi:MAG: hypothetical protein K0S90_3040 [Enterobacteriaceae bacterium]|nr:hypothetical protein [Enterobacteriaceae bacterium]
MTCQRSPLSFPFKMLNLIGDDFSVFQRIFIKISSKNNGAVTRIINHKNKVFINAVFLGFHIVKA